MTNRKVRRVVCFVLFAVYFLILVYFLFFAEKMGRVAPRNAYCYNIVPFKEITRFIRHADALGMKAVFLNIFGNVIAFIPFGFFIIPLLRRKIDALSAIMIIFDTSLVVEIIQLVTKVGSFDVDDVFLNTLGGAIGVGLYYLWKWAERIRKDGKV